MCDFGLITGAVSTLVGAAGAVQQGRAASQAADYNAKVSEMNATISEKRARDALERGQEEEQRKRQEIAQVQGRQRAVMSANGVDISFGSPMQAIVDTATLGEIDALTIRRNAAGEAYDYRVQAANGRADASLSRAQGANAAKAGYISAAGTLFGGAASTYKDYKKPSIGSIS